MNEHELLKLAQEVIEAFREAEDCRLKCTCRLCDKCSHVQNAACLKAKDFEYEMARDEIFLEAEEAI